MGNEPTDKGMIALEFQIQISHHEFDFQNSLLYICEGEHKVTPMACVFWIIPLRGLLHGDLTKHLFMPDTIVE